MCLFSTPKKLEIFEQCTDKIAVYDKFGQLYTVY